MSATEIISLVFPGPGLLKLSPGESTGLAGKPCVPVTEWIHRIGDIYLVRELSLLFRLLLKLGPNDLCVLHRTSSRPLCHRYILDKIAKGRELVCLA